MAGGPAGQADALIARFLPLHPKRIDLSLGRIQRLLADLGHPEARLPPVIHVAGTNGKGSTVAFMRAVLEAAGAASTSTPPPTSSASTSASGSAGPGAAASSPTTCWRPPSRAARP